MLRPTQQKHFMLTAALALILGVGAMVYNEQVWAARFAVVVTLMTASWFCSAVVIRGMTERRPMVLLAALFFKGLFLISLVFAIRATGFEITSFITGMLLYQVAIVLTMIIENVERRIRAGASATPPLKDRTSAHV